MRIIYRVNHRLFFSHYYRVLMRSRHIKWQSACCVTNISNVVQSTRIILLRRLIYAIIINYFKMLYKCNKKPRRRNGSLEVWKQYKKNKKIFQSYFIIINNYQLSVYIIGILKMIETITIKVNISHNLIKIFN